MGKLHYCFGNQGHAIHLTPTICKSPSWYVYEWADLVFSHIQALPYIVNHKKNPVCMLTVSGLCLFVTCICILCVFTQHIMLVSHLWLILTPCWWIPQRCTPGCKSHKPENKYRQFHGFHARSASFIWKQKPWWTHAGKIDLKTLTEHVVVFCAVTWPGILDFVCHQSGKRCCCFTTQSHLT